ncbi:hypothetical protein [Musicola paradisiaca]|uniref:hypothetical protein n=1 Tax=Musicola paradisiaca TaxID=69223 RepID=UPI0003132889|nr:hypothetical protein [Musicola paradisiaca]
MTITSPCSSPAITGLDKLVKDDLIALDGENIVPLSKRGNVGDLYLLRQRIF